MVFIRVWCGIVILDFKFVLLYFGVMCVRIMDGIGVRVDGYSCLNRLVVNLENLCFIFSWIWVVRNVVFFRRLDSMGFE